MMNKNKLSRFDGIMLIIFNGFRLDLVITLGFKYFIPRGGKAKMEEV